jgi:valyl-tRNA synthetase
VLADSKEKLSKSKENASMTPQGLLERFPADAIRYWTASGGLGQDIAFSESQLKIGQRLITKLWNAFWFTHEHIFDPSTTLGMSGKNKSVHGEPVEPGLVNQWLLHELSMAYQNYKTHFEQHEFGLALQVIEKFFWKIFCDNYLEIIKDQLFKPENYTEVELHATRWTLHQAGLRILQLYAPYMPYITESLYEAVYKKDQDKLSIHQTKFEHVQTLYLFEQEALLMNHIIDIIEQARKLKSEKQLSLKVPFASLTIMSENEHLLNQIMPHTQIIKGVIHAQEIHFKAARDTQSSLRQEADAWIAQIILGSKE